MRTQGQRQPGSLVSQVPGQCRLGSERGRGRQPPGSQYTCVAVITVLKREVVVPTLQMRKARPRKLQTLAKGTEVENNNWIRTQRPAVPTVLHTFPWEGGTDPRSWAHHGACLQHTPPCHGSGSASKSAPSPLRLRVLCPDDSNGSICASGCQPAPATSSLVRTATHL